MTLFDGPGEMRALCRDLDWTATALGPVDEWPEALVSAVRLMMPHGMPAILMWGPSLVQIYNDAFARILGVAHPGALGCPSRAAFPAEWHRAEPLFARVLSGETVVMEDLRHLLRRDGAVVQATFTTSLSPIIDASGNIGGLFGTAAEITDLARARLETERLRDERVAAHLQAARERALATSVLESMNDSYFALDRDARVVVVNGAMERATGAPRDSMIGRTLWELFPDAKGTEFERQYERAMREHVDVHITTRTPAQGASVLVEADAYPMDDGGIAVFWRDVTKQVEAAEALAESEARFRAVQDASPHGSTLYRPVRDEQGTIVDFEFVYVNPAGARLAGFAPDALIGRCLLEIFPHAIPNAVFGQYVKALEERAPVEWEARDMREGVDLGVHFIAVPVGDMVHVRYADITERMRHEKERDELLEAAESAKREAEKANKAKGEFLAIMSHELRTPLNAIAGYAELIDIGIYGPLTDAQHGALARIQQSQRHLLGLINGVLNYSRVEAGAVAYELTRVTVIDAVMEAESLVAPQLRAKGLQYAWHGCDATLAVTADREKLQQILLNLLSNAIKFTDGRDGEAGRIEVACEPQGAMVAVHVRDTGEGIPPDKLRAVFEPFVQIDQRLTRRKEGVGLGLTISRDLARGMGGELTAASTPGEGSTFTLTLPVG